MKNIFKQTLMSICLIIFYLSLITYIHIHEFSTKHVINNISLISSDYYKGRLCGTLENKLVEEYLQLKFKENNLKPFMGSYSQYFNITYPHKLNRSPYLNITDANGNIIKEFEYGVDYKEDMLNFKNNKFSFNNKTPNINFKNSSMQITKNSNCFLFYVPSNNKLEFRSSFTYDDPLSLCVLLSQNTFSSLKHYLQNGYNINCFIPFINKTTDVRNIMGYIEGKNPKASPIIISSHFDHLGEDLNNTIYSGALDNASGTAFMLEMIQYIRSLGTPEINILFVGFNAEELGCLGSNEFVKKHKNYIQDSTVFNFDMIGSDKGVPLCIMAGKKDTVKDKFITNLAKTFTKENIDFNYLFQDSSDHKAFRENNISAITLCDNDSSRIHTPNDTIEYISPSAINRCYIGSSKAIIQYAFANNPILLYNKELLLTSLCILTFFIIITSRKHK